MADITKLRIIALNVNFLISNFKRNELLRLLKEKVPDIVLLSETKRNDRHKIFYKDYDLIKKNRYNSINDGGTAILIKKNLAFEEICLNDKRIALEKTIIEIKTTSKKNFYVVFVYGTKKHNRFFSNELNNLLIKLKFNNSNNFCIIAGDFNAKQYLG